MKGDEMYALIEGAIIKGKKIKNIIQFENPEPANPNKSKAFYKLNHISVWNRKMKIEKL